MKLAITLAVLLVVFSLIGYSNQFGSTIDQSSVCLFDSDETAKQCKEGQLSFFQPNNPCGKSEFIRYTEK